MFPARTRGKTPRERRCHLKAGEQNGVEMDRERGSPGYRLLSVSAAVGEKGLILAPGLKVLLHGGRVTELRTRCDQQEVGQVIQFYDPPTVSHFLR